MGADVLLLIVRLAVLMAVTLTVPVVIFPVSVDFVMGPGERCASVLTVISKSS